MVRIIGTLTLLFVPTLAPANVCRWTDAEGRIHYSSAPPAGVACARTLRAPAPASEGATAAPSPGRTTQQLEMEFQQRRLKRAEDEQRAQAERREAEQRREECTQTRARVTWMEGGGRVTTLDRNGHRQFLDEEQHARELAALRRRASQLCR
jgi:hypothetical protein